MPQQNNTPRDDGGAWGYQCLVHAASHDLSYRCPEHIAAQIAAEKKSLPSA